VKHENEFEGKGRFPPWSRIPSLKEMAEEMEIDHDALVDCFAQQYSDEEIAARFNISSQVANSLREHFLKYGIGSVMGGD